MVAVKKPGKLRVRIDPKDLKEHGRAISHYPMPTMELKKATVFTILDAKDGYCQVKLDESSNVMYANNILDAFWTLQLAVNAVWDSHCTGRISAKTV